MEIIGTSSVIESNGGKISVTHDSGEVSFHFSTFKRDVFSKNDVFSHINRFWASKPKAFQENVFSIYVTISDYFFQINDKNYLTEKLKEALGKLYALHSFEERRNWVVFRSGLTIPNVDVTYNPDTDRDYTLEKTYIRSEYYDLLTTAFMLRLSIPIWSYYIRIIKDHAGTGLKEHAAFQLLEKTELFKSPAIRKMEAYIQANNKKQVVRSGGIGILSPEDHPFWIMTQFCVRKLSISELQFREEKATLVSLLYNFTRTCNSEGNFQDRYKDKTPELGSSEDGDETNKVSVYERHRNNTDLSIGEASEFENILGEVTHTAGVLCPTLPLDALARSVQTAAELLDINNLVLTGLPCQKTILGWILSPILSAEGIPYLRPDTVIRHMALAEALLWHRGFHFLALFMTSRTPLDNSVHHVSSPPIKSRLSDENLVSIRKHFPHVRMVQNRKSDPREECFIVTAIDNLSSEISDYTWIATADQTMLVSLQRSSTRRLNLAPDIRNEIARLIISIVDKSFYL